MGWVKCDFPTGYKILPQIDVHPLKQFPVSSVCVSQPYVATWNSESRKRAMIGTQNVLPVTAKQECDAQC